MDDLYKLYLESIGIHYLFHDGPESTQVPSADSPVPSETLENLIAYIGDCHRCPLGSERSRLVFGAGNSDAELVFVGEAPGREEDRTGEPFVGKAGQLLTDIIAAMGLSREDVYICNVIKCRPPGNRDPSPEEVSTCRPFLARQLRIISPRVVVALGSFAAQTLLETDIRISMLRGNFHDFHGISLMPTYHPSYLLRNTNMKGHVWEDMKKVMGLLGLKAGVGKS